MVASMLLTIRRGTISTILSPPPYTPEIKPGKKGKLPTCKEWRTYQMPDHHLLLRSAFKVDFASHYLEDLEKP